MNFDAAIAFSQRCPLPLISLTVEQTTDIVLYSADKYTKCVFTKEFGYVDQRAASVGSVKAIYSLCFEGLFSS